MDKLTAIFQDAQRSCACHNQSVKKLTAILSNSSQNEVNNYLKVILEYCLDNVLIVSKKEPTVERLISFLTSFFVACNEENLTKTLKHLLLRSQSTEKQVRFRSCQFIAEILSKLSTDMEFTSANVLDDTAVILLPRLTDKNATVRLWSIQAISQLQNADDVNDIVIKSIQRCLMSDSVSSVRSAAIEVILITKDTLPLIVDRIKDTSSEVRIACIKRLIKDVNVKYLKYPLNDIILRHSLYDRDLSVKTAALDLLQKWIEQLDNKIPKLLYSLNLRNNETQAERIGWILADEILSKRLKNESLYNDTMTNHPNFEGSFNSMNASELLWLKIRCEYASKNLTAVTRQEILENLLPEMSLLRDVLMDCSVTETDSTLTENHLKQLSFKYLLQMTLFINLNKDSSSCEQLLTALSDLIQNLVFPDNLVHDLLDAWARCIALNRKDGMNEVVTVINAMYLQYRVILQSRDDAAMQIPLTSLRLLQLITWMLTTTMKTSSGQDNHDLIIKHFESPLLHGQNDSKLIDFIWESLQQPLVLIRHEAIKALGLLGMSSETHCVDIATVLTQSIATDFEDIDIRCDALQALSDFAMVYPARFKNDTNYCNLLIRIINDGNHSFSGTDKEMDDNMIAENLLVYTAIEAATKLIFCGIMTESRLLALLMKYFFINSCCADMTALTGESREVVERSLKLNQILSLFFQAIFAPNNSTNLLSLVYDAIPELISDITMMLRDSDDCLDISIDKVMNQLLSLIDTANKSSTSEITSSSIRALFACCLSRDILKFSQNKVDKLLSKQYIKSLSSLTPVLWAMEYNVNEIVIVLKLITENIKKFDKTIQLVLENYIRSFDTIILQQKETDIDRSFKSFYILAPGLQDIVEMSMNFDEDDEQCVNNEDMNHQVDNSSAVVLQEINAKSHRQQKISSKTSNTHEIRKVKRYAVDDDEDVDDGEVCDDEEEYEENSDKQMKKLYSTRLRKQAVSSKNSGLIESNRICDENVSNQAINESLSRLSLENYN